MNGVRPGREAGGHGVELTLGSRRLRIAFPVTVRRADRPELRAIYTDVQVEGTGMRGATDVRLSTGCVLHVNDLWTADQHGVTLDRVVAVLGDGETAFVTSVAVTVPALALRDAEPFLPGVIYGNAAPVPWLSLGSPGIRADGLRELIVREDRAAAPVFTLREPDGSWVGVAHLDPRGGTVAADGEDVQGDRLVDARLDFGSVGAIQSGDDVELGFWFPGTEGECTYESGGLPLRQLRRPRERFHPALDGLRQCYRVGFRAGPAAGVLELHEEMSRWMWETLRPQADFVAVDAFLDATVDVLASQVQLRPRSAGIALESDPTLGRPLPGSSKAVMGFVGANTDAAAALLRASADGVGSDPVRQRALGTAVLDRFAALPADPSGGEGFDLATGEVTTYRTVDGEPAVFLRALAEGWWAALRASRIEADRGSEHPDWVSWAVTGAEWMLSQQRDDGHFPRSWRLDGQVLQESNSSSLLAVPFLLAVASHTGRSRFHTSALAAAEASWRDWGQHGVFAGATLDNPDVVDKEASTLALEAYLALHLATGDDTWLARARSAAVLSASWVHLWNIPMAEDADDDSAHWKRGRPTTGMQLITTGVTMSDGFLQVNAAAFAHLGHLTGERRWIDVARLVHHGSKSMLATEQRAFDLAGPGWQQEHWGFATNRGRGLNRSWLPWAAVATIDGAFRLRDLPHGVGDRVLRAV